jgi:hypothetical protein
VFASFIGDGTEGTQAVTLHPDGTNYPAVPSRHQEVLKVLPRAVPWRCSIGQKDEDGVQVLRASARELSMSIIISIIVFARGASWGAGSGGAKNIDLSPSMLAAVLAPKAF